jgi:hypothetical protein
MNWKSWVGAGIFWALPVSQSPVIGWLLPMLTLVTLGLALRSWIDLAHPREFRVRRTVQQGSEA